MAEPAVPGHLTIAASVDEATAVVTLSGEIDVHTSTELRRRLVDLIEAGARDVVLDLGEVEFIDSTGLGVLVGALKRLEVDDGSLALRHVRRSTQRVLEVTSLDKVLAIVD